MLLDCAVAYGLLQIALARDVIQRQSDASLIQPNLPHHIVEKLHDRYPAVRICLEKFGKDARFEEMSETDVARNSYNHL